MPPPSVTAPLILLYKETAVTRDVHCVYVRDYLADVLTVV